MPSTNALVTPYAITRVTLLDLIDIYNHQHRRFSWPTSEAFVHELIRDEDTITLELFQNYADDQRPSLVKFHPSSGTYSLTTYALIILGPYAVPGAIDRAYDELITLANDYDPNHPTFSFELDANELQSEIELYTEDSRNFRELADLINDGQPTDALEARDRLDTTHRETLPEDAPIFTAIINHFRNSNFVR